MANKKNIYERYFPNDEMTKYGFISHLEAYIKQLLNDPSTANVDDFLKKHGIDNEVALKMLLKTNSNDPSSAILIKSTSIRPDKESVDKNGGKTPKDVFHIKYKLPRKDYAKKMRNLFSNIYEKNINEDANPYEMLLSSTPSPFKNKKFGKVQSQVPPGTTGDRFAKYVNDNDNEYEEKLKLSKIDEGAWGKGPLDNDSALDVQDDFGKICLRILYNKTKVAQESDAIWSNLGVFIDFVKKYKDDELHFTDEYIDAVNFIKVKLVQLLNDKAWLSSWDDPSEMTSNLKKLYKTIASYQYHKEIMPGERMRGVDNPTMSLGESKINEDGEGGYGGCMGGNDGASTFGLGADGSYPYYDTTLKGKKHSGIQKEDSGTDVIKRKTMYITSEQEEYIKKKLNEDSPNVMGTQAGDFGDDAPASVCSSDDPTLDHKDMMKKSWEGK